MAFPFSFSRTDKKIYFEWWPTTPDARVHSGSTEIQDAILQLVPDKAINISMEPPQMWACVCWEGDTARAPVFQVLSPHHYSPSNLQSQPTHKPDEIPS